MKTQSHDRRRRGSVLIYATVCMVVFFAFVSLAVDFGRVQLAKTELQGAADAAALYAAKGVASGTGQIRTRAKAGASDNKSDGIAVTLKNADIEIGRWDKIARTFTVTNSQKNAIRITATKSAARGTAVQTPFAKFVGFSSMDMKAVAIAVYVNQVQVDVDVPATANPWLAGMPAGTQANPTNSWGIPRDQAGPYTRNGVFKPNGESPSQLTGLTLTPGEALTFDNIAGNGQNGPDEESVTADGNTNWVLGNDAGAEHGKSNLYAPISSVIGVFLDDSVPAGNVPPTLDFSSPESREFKSLAPQLRQMFFIGDGMTTDGDVQEFAIPPGATRLYIGKMDGYEWNNNIGVNTITIARPAGVSLVK